MNYKKTKLIITLTFVVAVTGTMALTNVFAQQNKSEESLPYVTSKGSGISFQNFSEMDESSEIIVRGTKINKEEVIIEKDNDNLAIDYRTLSDFHVSQLIKNEVNKKIEEGQVITVQENAASDGNFIYSTMGYQLMNDNEEYLLFLRPSKTEEDVYIIKGVYYGKVPVEESNSLLQNNVDIEFQGSDQEKNELQTIFEEARNKYLNQ